MVAFICMKPMEEETPEKCPKMGIGTVVAMEKVAETEEKGPKVGTEEVTGVKAWLMKGYCQERGMVFSTGSKNTCV